MIKVDKDDIAKRVASSMRKRMDAMVGYWISDIVDITNACESPIEVAFAAALMAADQIDHRYLRLDLHLERAEDEGKWREDLCLLMPQYQWAQYRIDFAIRLPKFRFKYLFIECDGHDFHERTKEQAARDRNKDRDIQQAGIPILRFTGSEIHKDAAACAFRVIDFVNDRYEDRLPRV